MKESGKKFINEVLGDDFLQDLVKFEMVNLKTDTAISHDEIADALKVVPRAVMTWLISNLTPMKDGDAKTFDLPFQRSDGAKMDVTKITNDVYHGEFFKNGKKINKFSYRSIPGIGLVLLTTFELYDMDDLAEPKKPSISVEPQMDLSSMQTNIGRMIEERLMMRDMVSRIVDGKLAQREAIEKMFLAKLGELSEKEAGKGSHKESKAKEKVKPSKPLKSFLDSRKKKKSFHLEMKKHETINCPECGNCVFSDSGISACMCFGENRNSKVFLKKTEDGYKLSFSNSWEPENIELLLSILRKNWESEI